MDSALFITFLVVSATTFAAPGPVVIFSIRNGLLYGVKLAAIGALGNISAFFLMVCTASFGLIGLLHASEFIFNLLKLVGAAYLIYLGLKMWMSPVSDVCIDNKSATKNKLAMTLYKQGFLITSSNPKAYVYISALLPQFINTNEALLPQVMVLAPCISTIQITVFMTYIIMASQSKGWFVRSQYFRHLNRIGGSCLLGCGVYVAR